MNGLTYFCKPRRRGGKIVLVVALATALLVIAAVATGCGSAKAKGVRGTDISYVKVMPSGDALTSGLTKMIKVPTNHDNLAFVVGVENGGDYLEQNIKVTLVIYQHPNADPPGSDDRADQQQDHEGSHFQGSVQPHRVYKQDPDQG